MMTDNELNEAVAIKLDDFKPNEHKVGNVILRGNSLSFPYPLYSNDIKAAWEVVEHLRKIGNHVLRLKSFSDGFYVTIHSGGVESKSTAPAAPRAICEAFLKMP